jgi:hypothetical protein
MGYPLIVSALLLQNLDKSIDNRALHDTFSEIGPILSSKVGQHARGYVRGRGMGGQRRLALGLRGSGRCLCAGGD